MSCWIWWASLSAKIICPMSFPEASARALSIYPPVLLADEPTGNLDTATGADILKLIHDLHDRLGATVLVVTHDKAVAESCPRTIHIRDGKISEDIRR
jgi:putative ABC transport system ATP-binding protein